MTVLYILTAVLTVAGITVYLKIKKSIWFRIAGFTVFGLGLAALLLLPAIWNQPPR